MDYLIGMVVIFLGMHALGWLDWGDLLIYVGLTLVVEFYTVYRTALDKQRELEAQIKASLGVKPKN